jgi:hypothetical protein
LSVQIGFVRNSVSISSISWRLWSASSILLDSFLEMSENSLAMSIPVLMVSTFEEISWFSVLIIFCSKGWRDWSIFHEIRFENAMSVES